MVAVEMTMKGARHVEQPFDQLDTFSKLSLREDFWDCDGREEDRKQIRSLHKLDYATSYIFVLNSLELGSHGASDPHSRSGSTWRSDKAESQRPRGEARNHCSISR